MNLTNYQLSRLKDFHVTIELTGEELAEIIRQARLLA